MVEYLEIGEAAEERWREGGREIERRGKGRHGERIMRERLRGRERKRERKGERGGEREREGERTEAPNVQVHKSSLPQTIISGSTNKHGEHQHIHCTHAYTKHPNNQQVRAYDTSMYLLV